MERIKQQPTRILALRVLSWIVYAVRPLQLEEVQHAVAVNELEPDDRSMSEESLTPQSIIVNACAGMIKIDEQSNIIGLGNKTTQDYFDRNGTKHFAHAQRNIGITCIKYLSLEVFSEGYCSTNELYERRLRENALLEYAARNLGNHIYQAAEDSLHDLALKLFLENHKLSCASQALFVNKSQWRYYSGMFPKDFQGVHYAAYFGLKGIVQSLFANSQVDPDSKDSYGRTPLSWAAANGYDTVVKLLLDTKKVDIDSKDSYSRTPLSWAAENGYDVVVKLLLKTKKIDIDSKDSDDGQTPLSRAVEKGHNAVVKLLE
jgi:hypothetical protein